MTAPTRRNVSLGNFSTFEEGASLPATVTVVSSVPFMTWSDGGDVFISQAYTVNVVSGSSVTISLIPTNLPGWTLNGQVVDVSGGAHTHSYKITATVGGHSVVYDKVLVPSGTGTLDVDTLAAITNDTGTTILVPVTGFGGGPTTSGSITDATTVGKAVLTAADQLAARTAIGAGTSNLALGTTATTALAGNTTAANIGGVPNTRLVAGQQLNNDITAATLTAALSAASTTAKGTVELATSTEAIAGTDATLVITASTLAAVIRPLLLQLTTGWPLYWSPTTGWPARATIPSWYTGKARYIADDPSLAAGSVSLPTDRLAGDKLEVLAVLLAA
jgi:hypothetical protein